MCIFYVPDSACDNEYPPGDNKGLSIHLYLVLPLVITTKFVGNQLRSQEVLVPKQEAMLHIT